MRGMKRAAKGMVAAVGVLGLSACGGIDQKAIDAAQPATGEDLVAYSQDITKAVKLDRDARLLQFFCYNATGGPCPADIANKLRTYGFKNDGSGVDLTYSFAVMVADAKDGVNDMKSTDRDFQAALYRVVLNRPPEDEGGANLAFLVEGGERKALVRAMMQSAELRSK